MDSAGDGHNLGQAVGGAGCALEIDGRAVGNAGAVPDESAAGLVTPLPGT